MIVVVNVRNLNYLSVSLSILPIVALEALQSGVHRNLVRNAAALYISFTLHISNSNTGSWANNIRHFFVRYV